MTRRTKGPKRRAEAYATSGGRLDTTTVEAAWLAGYRAAARTRKANMPAPRRQPRYTPKSRAPFEVFVAIGYIDYENTDVLGVFLSREGAEAHNAKRIEQHGKWVDGNYTTGYDRYKIETWSVEP